MSREPSSMLITGGGSGIGRAIAEAALADGRRVWLTARDGPSAQALARELDGGSGRARGLALELSDPGSPAHLVAELNGTASEAGGFPSDVVLNAGWIEPHGPFDRGLASDPSQEPYAAHLEVDFLGQVRLLSALKGSLPRPAHILAIASAAGLRGFPGIAGYVAAKHALVGWVRALALDFEAAALPLSIGALCPYYVEGRMLERAIQHRADELGESQERAREAFAARNPSGRLIPPEAVARAALDWLRAPKNGQVLVLDGGPVRESPEFH